MMGSYNHRLVTGCTLCTETFLMFIFLKLFSLLRYIYFVFDRGLFILYSALVCRDFPYNLIANVLVSLTLKDTRTGLKFLLGTDGLERYQNHLHAHSMYFLLYHAVLLWILLHLAVL